MDKMKLINKLLRYCQFVGLLTYHGRVPDTQFKSSSFLKKYSMVNVVSAFCMSAALMYNALITEPTVETFLWYSLLLVVGFVVKLVSLASFRNIVPIFEKFSRLHNYIQPRNFPGCRHRLSDFLICMYTSFVCYHTLRGIYLVLTGNYCMIIRSFSSVFCGLTVIIIPFLHNVLGCCLLELLDGLVHQILENVRVLCENNKYYLQSNDEHSISQVDGDRKEYSNIFDRRKIKYHRISQGEVDFAQEGTTRKIRRSLREAERLLMIVDNTASQFLDFNSLMFTIEAGRSLLLNSYK